MDFCGKKTYISTKKNEKIQKLRENKFKNDLVIKEEVEEELKESICSIKKNISRSDDKRKRSRSNSQERVQDEALDNDYSDPEFLDEDIIEKSHDLTKQSNFQNNSSLLKEKKSGGPGLLGSIKSFFSGIKKEDKNVQFSQPVLNSKERCTKPKTINNLSTKLGQNKVEYQQEVDFNVLTFKFNFLSQKVSYATGDPTICKDCEAILNFHSKLTKTEITNKYIWKCEFCTKQNEIFLENEEIPKEESVDYFVQSMSQLNKGLKDMNYNDEQTVVFCFDVSGSMCVSEQLVGKHKFKGVNMDKYSSELMKFSDGSDQFYQGGSRNTTYVSRLQCLQGAIENHLINLEKACPNRKIGFVIFNNEVVGIGDGSKPEVKINGNNLNDFDKIKEIGEQNTGIINRSLKDTSETLLKHLYSIEESGQTALGPAILFSISLITGSAPGSKIILCTDGISNIGLGSLDFLTKEEFDKSKLLYESLGQMAKDKGIIISLITFQGEESKIEILSLLCEMTGGDIIKVKPSEILGQFSNLLTTEVIATNVKISVKLHKMLSFRNESDFALKHDGSTLVKDIGNATNETETYIEYNFKPSKDIVKNFPDFDLEKIEAIPFQSIIEYTSKNGDKCIRVITKLQSVSSNKEEIAKDAKYEILSVNAMKKSSALAKEGNYRGAQANAMAWKQMLKKNTDTNVDAQENYLMFNKNMKNFNHQIQQVQYDEVLNNNFINISEAQSSQVTNNRSQQRTDSVSNEIFNLNHMNVNKAKKK